MRRVDSLEKTLMLGRIGGKRRRGRQRMRWLNGISDLMDVGLGELWEMVMDSEVWHAAIHVVTKNWTWLSNWTELNWTSCSWIFGLMSDINMEKLSFCFFFFLLLFRSFLADIPITWTLHFGCCPTAGKESACIAGDLGSVPELGRSPGEGKAIHSSILPWRILWTFFYSVWGHKESHMAEWLSLFFTFSYGVSFKLR